MGKPKSESPASRWSTVLFSLLVIVLPFAVLYWTVPYVGETTVGMDYVLFPTAHQQELFYSVSHGTWPLYVPGFAGGRPAAALTLGQLYHPISHLASHIPGYWSGRALEHNTLLRLLFLGLTHLVLLGLLRRWGLRLEIAFLLSFIAVYNMRMLDAFRFGAALESYTGHLLLCGAVGLHYLTPTRLAGPAAMAGSTYLLVVGGHPQMSYFGLLGGVLFALAVPFVTAAVRGEERPSLAEAARFYGVVAACVLVGVLLASAYAVPLYFDFVAETPVRAEMDYEWSLHNKDSWGGELNNFFRPLHVSLTGAFGGSTIILLAALVPLALPLRRPVPWGLIATWAGALLIIVLALGDATPLHYLFWKYFPLAHSFRVPGRITFVLPALFLLLLAWVFTDAQRRNGRRANPLTLLAGLGLASVLVYQLLSDRVAPPSYPVPTQLWGVPEAHETRIAWTGAAALALAAALGWSKRARGAIGLLLALTVVAQTGMVLRFGTWVVPKKPSITAARLEERRTASLFSSVNPGNRMYSDLVNRRMSDSFIDGHIAKFYRKYEVVADEAEAFRALASTREPDEIVVERFTPDPAAGLVAPAADGVDRVVLEEATFNRLAFSVRNAAPGFLNLTLLDRHRWRAFVEGRSVRAYRANGGEWAVYLQPGEHRVEFRFWSPAAFAGVLLSLATLCLCGVFVALRLPPARRWARVALLLAAGLVPAALFGGWWLSLYRGEDLGTRYAWDSSELPDASNLAYGKKTRMSSILNRFSPYECYAGRAVDGERTEPGFATALSRTPPWWEVDLGRLETIDEIVVYPGERTVSQGLLRLAVLLSDDGERFRQAAWLPGAPARPPWSVALGGQPARFVRLQLGAPGLLALDEVEIRPLAR